MKYNDEELEIYGWGYKEPISDSDRRNLERAKKHIRIDGPTKMTFCDSVWKIIPEDVQ